MTNFVNNVMRRLPQIEAESLEYVYQVISNLENRGFSEQNAYAYCMCLEEVNPELDEETALKRMREVSAKYPPKKKPMFGTSTAVSG